MTITNENLFSEAYNSVKSFLNGIPNLDPRNRYKANWIHSSMPNINDKGFDGYPFIVLSVGIEEGKTSFDITSEKTFRVLISVYSKDALEVDNISNKIYSLFKTSLNNFGAKELSSSPIDWNLDLNGQKILFRNLGFLMRSRI